MRKLLRLLKHRWFDRADTTRAIPDAMAERLAQRVTASEARHTGEIRLCVEAALPAEHLWHTRGDTPMEDLVHQRALEWFGRLRVWDTEHNNGVLIYLLLSEHAIEIVADRSLHRCVPQSIWNDIVTRLGQRLKTGAFEDGLTEALSEVSALLVTHFPLDAAAAGEERANQLPDCVVRV